MPGGVWEGGVRAANRVADIVALLWQHCAGVVCTHSPLNKWIWNDLQRVSATWAQTHTPLPAYTYNAMASVDHAKVLMQRCAQIPRGKGGAASFCTVLVHIIQNWDTPVGNVIRLGLILTLLYYTYSLSNTMENMTYIMRYHDIKR